MLAPVTVAEASFGRSPCGSDTWPKIAVSPATHWSPAVPVFGVPFEAITWQARAKSLWPKAWYRLATAACGVDWSGGELVQPASSSAVTSADTTASGRAWRNGRVARVIGPFSPAYDWPMTEPTVIADSSVRLARATDAPAAGTVQAIVFRLAYRDLLPEQVLEAIEPTPFTRAWRDALANPPSPVHRLLVACAGVQVVGLAAIVPSTDPDHGANETGVVGASAGELTVFGVHPDARRQGHGSRLLNAAADTARGAGLASLSAWVLDQHSETRAFLLTAGFAPDGASRTREIGGAQALTEHRLTADLSTDLSTDLSAGLSTDRSVGSSTSDAAGG